MSWHRISLFLCSLSNSYLQVNPSDVIILEGILVFHDPRVRELMNMKIFVDTGLYALSLLLNVLFLFF